MKLRRWLFTLIPVLAVLIALGVYGSSLFSRVKRVTIQSSALPGKARVNIYLPKGYNDGTKYPVLYALHGYGADEKTWMPSLGAEKIADRLIGAGEIEPMIIVAPYIDDSWGLNSPGEMYEDFLCGELIAYVDGHYSTITAREGRYIGGISMGGTAALRLAFTHPDLFSKAGGHSPALWPGEAPGVMGLWVYPDEKTRDERDPLRLARTCPLGSLDVYLDCGEQDDPNFVEGCDELYATLQARGIESELHLSPGAHDADYWRPMMEEYLRFYGGGRNGKN